MRNRRRPRCRIEREEQQQIERIAAPVGDDEGAVEGLEGLDRLQHQVEEDDRREQRQGDGEEAAHAAGGVDLGRLVELLRDGAQPGEEDQHGRAELPHGEDDQRIERVVGIGEPIGALDAEDGEDRVDDAAVGEELAPQDGDGDGAAEDRGQVEERPVDADGADALVEDDGDGEREDQRAGDRQEDVGEGDLQRLPEAVVPEQHVVVVVEPDEARRARDVVLGERQVERGQNRADGEEEEPDQPQGEEDVAGCVLAEEFSHLVASVPSHGRSIYLPQCHYAKAGSTAFRCPRCLPGSPPSRE